MLHEKHISRLLAKMVRLEEMLEPMLFRTIDTLPVRMYETKEQRYIVPEDSLFSPCDSGTIWGEENGYCWFKGSYTVPQEYHGFDLFLYPKTNAYETLLFVDEIPAGVFASKIIVHSHGNHYCNLIQQNATAGEEIQIALEAYAGHTVKGCMPFEETQIREFSRVFETIEICIKDESINDFYFDLKTVNQAVEALDNTSFRRAELVRTLIDLHEIVYYDPYRLEEEVFVAALAEGAPLLKEALAKTNSQSAPIAGLIGHSHMDTAWLWTIDETVNKCARTFSNQLQLMDQYPEYTFIQSSAYHGDMIRQHYPELFQRMKSYIAQGRYEPNGGVWVESDCNITSGESLIRQFLWGQRFTQEHFGYTSDTFWLPDTFGYSASIPQIMKGCGVEYFLTTKLLWNDTTEFPYDTFYWKGLDGTKVLTHFNKTHIWPDPKNLMEFIYGREENNVIKEKIVTNRRLLSYGFGDGGGGPQFEMIEMARRVKDFEGLPKAEHTTVSQFMQDLEESLYQPSEYSGELYLELHRGTLTSQHAIKRNNRLGEIALHSLEFLTVQSAVEQGTVASGRRIHPLMNTVLVNQFHDILPGTSIPAVHQQAKKEMSEMLDTARTLTSQVLAEGLELTGDSMTVINPMSAPREDAIYWPYDGRMVDTPCSQQIFQDLHGRETLAVQGVPIEGYSSAVLPLTEGSPKILPEEDTPFRYTGDTVTTPFAVVSFSDNGGIDSFVDRRNQRELRGEGYPLNTFLTAEDVPQLWDNWDIDADIQLKLDDRSTLVSRKVVAQGAVELRLRSVYQITSHSTITQDMIFFAHSPEVRFHTLMDWQDDHILLKTAFDTTVFSDVARFEVQFGHAKRPTTRNTAEEKAKFEVLNHKYTDISEARYGVALLNDCKYGISVKDSQMRLTLHKGGLRPDDTGDKGLHECTYSFLPHDAPFSADSVVRPAYALNYPPIIAAGRYEIETLASVKESNIIIETIKPCEDEEKAFILRFYDSEGTYTNANLSFGKVITKVEETNMLEESSKELSLIDGALMLPVRAFEIKTLKLYYS